MPFKRLSLYISHQAVMPFTQLHTASIELLYSHFMKGKSFAGCHSINLYFTTNTSEQGKTQQHGGFLDFYSLFDFQAFSHLDESHARKQFLLCAIHKAALCLAQQQGWPADQFEQAYQACLR